MIRRLAEVVLSRMGYTISRKAPTDSSTASAGAGYDLESEAWESMQVVRSHTMVPYARLVTLYQQVVACERHDIAGSYVECGTWKGGAVGLMALGNLRHSAQRRHIHLFDSFAGIPEPDEEVDGERAVQEVVSVGGEAKGRLVPIKGFYDKYADGVGDLETNRHLLETVIGYDSRFLHYHEGWFQDTLPRVAPVLADIAILRLDCDWYASTRICLEYLYNKVVTGGFVVIDDYGYYDGCKRAADEFMTRERIRAYLNHIDASGRYWIKP